MEIAASQLIKLYMQRQALVGYIYYAPTPEARLLDALNGLSDMGPIKRGNFIELADATIENVNGSKEKLRVSYVNKATIQLAVTLGNADSGRGIGAQSGPRVYPFVEKSPLPVQIETQDYIINGNMYHVSFQRIWHVLEDVQTFLPLTHASVFTLANGNSERFPFAAVNKAHIRSLQEEKVKQKIDKTDNRGISEKNVMKQTKR